MLVNEDRQFYAFVKSFSVRLQLNVLLCRVVRAIPSEKPRVTRLHKVTLIALLVQNN